MCIRDSLLLPQGCCIRKSCIRSDSPDWYSGTWRQACLLYTSYNTENSELHSDFVRSIAQDEKGRFWIGTFGEDVYKRQALDLTEERTEYILLQFVSR